MILAIETAAEVGGVALLQGERLIAERALEREHSFNASLLPAIDSLLRETGCSLEEVSTIALSIGPGSFTGLRIGLATALGLCFGTPRLIVPVPTLAALSLNSADAPRISPILDARKAQVYAGLYGPGARPLGVDRVTDPLPWFRELRGQGPVVLLGPGALLYRNEIQTVLGPEARMLPSSVGNPTAASVGRLGARLRVQGLARSPGEIRLSYLRRAEAEERGRGAPDTPEASK